MNAQGIIAVKCNGPDIARLKSVDTHGFYACINNVIFTEWNLNESLRISNEIERISNKSLQISYNYYKLEYILKEFLRIWNE